MEGVKKVKHFQHLVVSQFQVSLVLPLCSLCLCGGFIEQTSTTETQRPTEDSRSLAFDVDIKLARSR